jgi:hypothetical protein
MLKRHAAVDAASISRHDFSLEPSGDIPAVHDLLTATTSLPHNGGDQRRPSAVRCIAWFG